MAQLLVRQIDEDVKQRLKARAARHGVSMEEEARAILRAAAFQREEEEFGLGTRIANLFKDIDWGDEELEPLPRTPLKPVDFDK